MLKHTSAKDLPAHMRLSEDQTTELADMFRLMSDPSRLQDHPRLSGDARFGRRHG